MPSTRCRSCSSATRTRGKDLDQLPPTAPPVAEAVVAKPLPPAPKTEPSRPKRPKRRFTTTSSENPCLQTTNRCLWNCGTREVIKRYVTYL